MQPSSSERTNVLPRVMVMSGGPTVTSIAMIHLRRVHVQAALPFQVGCTAMARCRRTVVLSSPRVRQRELDVQSPLRAISPERIEGEVGGSHFRSSSDFVCHFFKNDAPGLTVLKPRCYDDFAGWSSLVARWAHNPAARDRWFKSTPRNQNPPENK